MSPKWRTMRPQTPSCYKDQQLDSYLQVKVALKQLRSPFKKLQQYCRTKNLRITAQNGKKKHLYFTCIIPFP